MKNLGMICLLFGSLFFGLGSAQASSGADGMNTVQLQKYIVDFQSAVKSGSPEKVASLIDFPITYSDNSSKKMGITSLSRKDFVAQYPKIMSSSMKQVLLTHNSKRLFRNYKGAMIGAGQFWFNQRCLNRSCSRVGKISLSHINKI